MRRSNRRRASLRPSIVAQVSPISGSVRSSMMSVCRFPDFLVLTDYGSSGSGQDTPSRCTGGVYTEHQCRHVRSESVVQLFLDNRRPLFDQREQDARRSLWTPAPCSHFLSVPSGMPMLRAKVGCDGPPARIAMTSGQDTWIHGRRTRRGCRSDRPCASSSLAMILSKALVIRHSCSLQPAFSER